MGISPTELVHLAKAHTTTAATSVPYPNSQLITAMSWDLSAVPSLRKAAGSDLWPMTWARDGNLYGAWGDGGGFAGSNTAGRVSLGFAAITGAPVAGSPSSFTGINLWGDVPQYAMNAATFGGKVDDLISIGGVLYAQGGLWTKTNCGCSDPVHKSGDNPKVRQLAYSSDLGKSWSIAAWTAAEGWGGSLQYGRDYSGAWDPNHVYLYYGGDIQSDPQHMYLRRVSVGRLLENPATVGHYEYWIGQQSDGTPMWSTNRSGAVPIFTDSNVPQGTYMAGGAVYDAPLGRYILTSWHGNNTGQVGFFEAPHPWGPWATLGYYDDWGGYNETAGESVSLQFPSKWISSDGRTLWAVFSGVNAFDSFNVAKVSLTASGEFPKFTAPASGSLLKPGSTVTAAGSGPNLTWSASLLKEGGPPIATGKGNSFTFLVPSNVASGELVRITLSNTLSSVYRDYEVAESSALPTVEIQSVSTGAKDEVGTAQLGAEGYIDRAYVFTKLSSPLSGGRYIRGANDDKFVTVGHYLEISVDRPATLHVCYSEQATQLPAWLSDGTWMRTTDVCDLNDLARVPRAVYQKRVAAGSIVLGGNREAPAAGEGNWSNYVVIVTP